MDSNPGKDLLALIRAKRQSQEQTRQRLADDAAVKVFEDVRRQISAVEDLDDTLVLVFRWSQSGCQPGHENRVLAALGRIMGLPPGALSGIVGEDGNLTVSSDSGAASFRLRLGVLVGLLERAHDPAAGQEQKFWPRCPSLAKFRNPEGELPNGPSMNGDQKQGDEPDLDRTKNRLTGFAGGILV